MTSAGGAGERDEPAEPDVPVEPAGALDRAAAEQSGTEQPGEKAGTEQSGEKAGTEQSGEKAGTEQSGEKAGTEQPGEKAGTEPTLSRRRRAVAAAAAARDRTITRLVSLLGVVIRATGKLLTVVVGVAAVPALLLLAVALTRPGPDDGFWIVLVTISLGLAVWLGIRRHQLLTLARRPAELAAQFTGAVRGREVWDRVTENLLRGGTVSKVVRGRRALRLLRGMWRGIRMTGIVDVLADSELLAPLTPGRLRGLGFLVIACLVAGLICLLGLGVALLLYLLGA